MREGVRKVPASPRTLPPCTGAYELLQAHPPSPHHLVSRNVLFLFKI